MEFCSRRRLVVSSEWFMNNSQKILGKHLVNFFIKKTLYNHFVIGENETEICSFIELQTSQNIRTMIMMCYEDDLGLVSEDIYNSCVLKNKEEFIKMIKLLKSKNDTLVHFKMTGFFLFSTLRKLSTKIKNQKDYVETILAVKNIFVNEAIDAAILDDLETSEKKYLSTGIKAIKEIMEHTNDCALKVLVDAEYTDVNEGINAIVAAMLMLYNKSSPKIGFTFQCYLKNSIDTITRNLDIIKEYDLCWSCKFVRGAYMDYEGKKSKMEGLPNPVHDSYEDTNTNYDKAVKMHPTVNGQLMGMSDHISLQLGSLEFKIYKSSPYGTVEDSIPYLVRRVYKNSSIFDNLKNEVPILRREFARRLNPFSSKN